ncbi:uncharacterized protein K489DRAFT_367148 [Dissoconium aciculare CBS 342.82]|uniref:Uncharacterized protein n=1 Tax=Dissoconium aciculare CBS 342.82 TaxID=1314786 RepID=A0A6J3MDA6_9PEZI|nr:uncharacterized protein K489DRAFT_367148 [Dissoconium aciculare CBS 342.82]KAF1825868.1 hypothetical protein K489DRAFT_367148 [Dissoconium aciculare CBS 342.82]
MANNLDFSSTASQAPSLGVFDTKSPRTSQLPYASDLTEVSFPAHCHSTLLFPPNGQFLSPAGWSAQHLPPFNTTSFWAPERGRPVGAECPSGELYHSRSDISYGSAISPHLFAHDQQSEAMNPRKRKRSSPSKSSNIRTRTSQVRKRGPSITELLLIPNAGLYALSSEESKMQWHTMHQVLGIQPRMQKFH